MVLNVQSIHKKYLIYGALAIVVSMSSALSSVAEGDKLSVPTRPFSLHAQDALTGALQTAGQRSQGRRQAIVEHERKMNPPERPGHGSRHGLARGDA